MKVADYLKPYLRRLDIEERDIDLAMAAAELMLRKADALAQIRAATRNYYRASQELASLPLPALQAD